ncbi:MAG: glycosyltransferase [Acidobacteriota bacterium]
MKTKSAIAILYYNKAGLTETCINSVLESGCSPASVFCLSNGSEKKVFKEITENFPSLNHFEQEENNGYSGGVNSLLKKVFSSGFDSVLFLTNDTTINSSTLKNCIKTHQKTGSGFIAPTIYYKKKPDKVDSSAGFFDLKRVTLSHYHTTGLPLYLDPNSDYIPGTSFWITKEVFEKLGGMDESYHTYWEDVDFSFRGHKNNIKMARSFDSEVYHSVGQTCHKKPFYTTYLFQRNRINFCNRYLNESLIPEAKRIIRSDLNILKSKALEKGDKKREQYILELEEIL